MPDISIIQADLAAKFANVFPLNDAFMAIAGVKSFWQDTMGTLTINFSNAQPDPGNSDATKLIYSGTINSAVDATPFLEKIPGTLTLTVSNNEVQFTLHFQVEAHWKFQDSFRKMAASLNYSNGVPAKDKNFLYALNLSATSFLISSSPIPAQKVEKGFNVLTNLEVGLPYKELSYFTSQKNIALAGTLNSTEKQLRLTGSLGTFDFPFKKQFSITDYNLDILSNYGENNTSDPDYELNLFFESDQYFRVSCNLNVLSYSFQLYCYLCMGGSGFMVIECIYDPDQHQLKNVEDLKTILGSLPPDDHFPPGLEATKLNASQLYITYLSFGLRADPKEIGFVECKLEYRGGWDILPGKIRFEKVALELMVTGLNTGNIDFTTGVAGYFRLGDKTTDPLFKLSLSYPGWVAYCTLEENAIDLVKIFEYFDINPGNIGINKLTCTGCDINVDIPSKDFSIFIDLKGDWEIAEIGANKVRITDFTLGCSVESKQPSFYSEGRFSIGQLNFSIKGSYGTNSGWDIEGLLTTIKNISLEDGADNAPIEDADDPNTYNEEDGIPLTDLVGRVVNFFGGQMPDSIPNVTVNNIYVHYRSADQFFEFRMDVNIGTVSIGNITFKPIGFRVQKKDKYVFSFFFDMHFLGTELKLLATSEGNFETSYSVPAEKTLKLSDLTSLAYSNSEYSLLSTNDIDGPAIVMNNAKISLKYKPDKEFHFSTHMDKLAFKNFFSASFGLKNFDINVDTYTNDDSRKRVSIAADVIYSGNTSPDWNLGRAFIYFPNKAIVFGFKITGSLSIGTLLNSFLGISISRDVDELLPVFKPVQDKAIRLYKASSSDTGIKKIKIDNEEYPVGYHLDQLVIQLMRQDFQVSIDVTDQNGFELNSYAPVIDLYVVKLVQYRDTNVAQVTGRGPSLNISSKNKSISIRSGFLLFPKSQTPWYYGTDLS